MQELNERSNSNINYLFEKQEQYIKNFAAEYASFFQYKSIKRFLPPMELTQYDEEVIKSRLHTQAKLQESKFIAIFKEMNSKVKMEQILNDLNEYHAKNEIMKEISSEKKENCLSEKEEDWLDKKMLIYLNNTLKKQLQEDA